MNKRITFLQRLRLPRTSASVCRAIISSSSVGTTRTLRRLLGVETVAACAALAPVSSSAPSQPSRPTTRARISGLRSPMPAVNTSPSIPPMAAASAPASRTTRWTK